MGDVLFLALRRLRAPLITIICVYAISVGGLTLMPGIDGSGQAHTMSFFHAFYVISFTATTIGFGEIPYPFTDAQRMWVTFSIYLSVVAWAYSLGTVIAMTNDLTFRAMLARSVFKWRVRGIAEPFYIVCGYGQSGAALAHALDSHGTRLVVVEPRAERVAHVVIEEYITPPLALAADGRLADVLEDCGIHSPYCVGLIALAGDDGVTQAIAIGARERSGDGAPLAWTFACDVMQPGMFGAFFQRPGDPLRIGHLVADPTDPSERLAATALLLERQGEPQLLPDDGTELKPGDRILFVGKDSARRLQLRYLNEPGTVAWVCSGREPPRGLVFRWWQEHSRSA